jgi:hypothetical protein
MSVRIPSGSPAVYAAKAAGDFPPRKPPTTIYPLRSLEARTYGLFVPNVATRLDASLTDRCTSPSVANWHLVVFFSRRAAGALIRWRKRLRR